MSSNLEEFVDRETRAAVDAASTVGNQLVRVDVWLSPDELAFAERDRERMFLGAGATMNHYLAGCLAMELQRRMERERERDEPWGDDDVVTLTPAAAEWIDQEEGAEHASQAP
jgi:hypothetical protein